MVGRIIALEKHIHNLNPTFFLGVSNIFGLASALLLSKATGDDIDDGLDDIPPAAEKLVAELKEAVKSLSREDAARLTSTDCRQDLTKAAKLVWRKTVEAFYENHGYSAGGPLPPDHLAVQLAFASSILREAAMALARDDREEVVRYLKLFSRFASAHLIPTARGCTNGFTALITELTEYTNELVRPLLVEEISRLREAEEA